MHRERLKKLELALRQYVVEQPENLGFALTIWYQKQKYNECGYTGCAIGIALHYGLFEDEGFHLHYDETTMMKGTPLFGGVSGFSAVCDFFQLLSQDAQHLFTALSKLEGVPIYGSAGALATADRIRDLLGPDEVIVPATKAKVLEPA